jgi:hypothetical protein
MWYLLPLGLASAPRSPTASCCFRDEDVKLHRARGSGSEMLVVDNFLCSDTLSNLLGIAATSYNKGLWKGIEEGEAFPGSWLQIGRHFAEGGYLDCVTEAARVAGLAPKTPPVDALVQPDSSGGSEARLGNIFRKPHRNFVHVDEGSLVINVHLSSRHNDTGTQFWSSKGAPDVYGLGQGSGQDEETQLSEAMAVLEAFPDEFSLDDAILVATGGPGNRPADYSGRIDPTGVFQHLESVPFRLNRLLAYSGHLFHSALVEGDSSATLNVDPRVGRVILQEFRQSPGLERVVERYERYANDDLSEAAMNTRQEEAWDKFQQLGGIRRAGGQGGQGAGSESGSGSKAENKLRALERLLETRVHPKTGEQLDASQVQKIRKLYNTLQAKKEEL